MRRASQPPQSRTLARGGAPQWPKTCDKHAWPRGMADHKTHFRSGNGPWPAGHGLRRRLAGDSQPYPRRALATAEAQYHVPPGLVSGVGFGFTGSQHIYRLCTREPMNPVGSKGVLNPLWTRGPMNLMPMELASGGRFVRPRWVQSSIGFVQDHRITPYI